MEIIYARGRASAGEVLEALADPPSYSAVRALLRVLETKGHVRHVRDGARYVYLPIQARHRAARSALTQVVQTFFGGSLSQMVAGLLRDGSWTDAELEELRSEIERARRDVRKERKRS